ncbi:hypothetical protein BX285_1508 [Streptomyces sp. 1114.5]|uniref:hypothetical protein n=1 Tax=unclassified Streptomyces TaxID=2593676 RepID=UPI000BCA3ADC|nr:MULTISPECIES: hypothetical protein [unclassified Streptomyces]RKT17144.1 hypothetical protein BX285_1508 [Streptomyces sp. 1114.5]SOB83353.1 hypothetical protein SAMN06272789_3557 [Streptomyces sp. 1331.2]
MATNQMFNGLQVNRSLLAGGVLLTGVGSLLGAAGAAMVCTALFTAGRSWVRNLETPPTALAQRALHDAKVASSAGWDAWRAQHSSPN